MRPPPSASWRVSNVGPRTVRVPLSFEGGCFGLRAGHACPEILPPGRACEVEVVFAPIPVGQVSDRLRAGTTSAALLGIVSETRVRAKMEIHGGRDGWEAELRNTGILAFVAPAASLEGAAVLANGRAGCSLATWGACWTRLAGLGLVFFPSLVARFGADPP